VRIQLTSDVHLEHLEYWFPGARTIAPAHGADLLVLAGDIGQGANALRLFRDWPAPVLYVAGNHEAYGSTWPDTIAALREAAQGSSVLFLERDVADFGGVRFLGCTLWTDYRLRSSRTQRQSMEHAESHIADHRRIRAAGGGYFTPADALREHEISRAWLVCELARPYDGKTVVITHHGPHALSVHPRYVGNLSNAAFVSDLGDLLRGPDLWLHGHVHDSFDYSVAGCRVVANPRGYPLNASSCELEKELIFENPRWKCALVLEV